MISIKLLIIINRILDNIEEVFVSSAIIITGFILFFNVIFRYFFGFTLFWAEEFTRYILVSITFIGGSICVRDHDHVNIDVLTEILPDKSKKHLDLFVYIISIIFCIIMVYIGFKLVFRTYDFGQKSPAMRVPVWIPYLGMPIGFGLMSIRYLQQLIRKLMPNKFNERR